MPDPDAPAEQQPTDPPLADPVPADPVPAGLDAVADRLYRVRPDEFVPERDAAVARAKEQDDRELARAIAKLRRPTRAAWLANLLARDRAEQLEGLLGLAAGLADAQRTLDGTALRKLSSQRHRLVAAVAQEAARLARAEHEPVGEALVRDLQGILEAALADPVIADEVRSGRLTRTVTYSGFGPAADPTATPAPPRRETPATADIPADRSEPDGGEDREAEVARLQRERAERERREEALAAAEAEEATARDQQEADEAARDEAVAARDAARERVTELSGLLDVARDAERAATAAAREAEAAARASARAASAAAARTDRARSRLTES